MKMLLKIHELLISLQKVKEIGESEKGFYLLIVLIPLCEDLFPRMWAIVRRGGHPHPPPHPVLDLKPNKLFRQRFNRKASAANRTINAKIFCITLYS